MTETKPTIKLMAVDLDGTLLNSDHRISPRTDKALRAALDQGVKVVIATGKTRSAAEWIYESYKLTTPGIFVQGTVIYNPDGTLKAQHLLDARTARQIITFAEDRGFFMIAYSGNRILARQEHPRLEELTVNYHEPKPEVVGPLQNRIDDLPIHKILAVKPGDARAVTALRWQLGYQMDAKTGTLLQAGVGDTVEILAPNSSKGVMLKQLMKEWHIPASEVLAIGDAENDIDMIKLAGTGIAMGNASAVVQQTAKYTVASNDADGVAEAIERFVLVAPEVKPEPVVVVQPAVAEAAAVTPAAD
jgi:Cof subfamily protein (haloacid dehalogenase superfamily)